MFVKDMNQIHYIRCHSFTLNHEKHFWDERQIFIRNPQWQQWNQLYGCGSCLAFFSANENQSKAHLHDSVYLLLPMAPSSIVCIPQSTWRMIKYQLLYKIMLSTWIITSLTPPLPTTLSLNQHSPLKNALVFDMFWSSELHVERSSKTAPRTTVIKISTNS